MEKSITSVITGTGSYIPETVVDNSDFLDHSFLERNGDSFGKSNREIIEKFQEITGIKQRRYADDNWVASDLAAAAAEKAIEDSGMDPESLDYIIVAHNFGDVRHGNRRSDMVPSLASRVKAKLKIINPECIAYDLPFGCPGWLQGIIQANYFIRSGDANSALIIGTETLSRISDPHDRDSMIYADGAGATILQAGEPGGSKGILSHAARTDTESQAFYLAMDKSYNHNHDDTLFLKMDGRKLYQYAITHVPGLVKKSIDKANLEITDIKKVLIHQANEKMDEAILSRLFKLYDLGSDDIPDGIMPMTISWLGNTSVATVPTLLDLIIRDEMEGQQIHPGDEVVFASVGAGMNINSVVYRF
ncbi:ketoacyl-ACP synthase III [Rhodohalobacter sp. SW132]|uniref:3-oxoacyl-ACP synthase III family protein n=1 Tax=Rhodohalobacter sp. SW132 TaxID=2293433 RepID=UPI000E23B11D|nr:ketoacyl-ACP synthase III [Rhodohalobacter sp. SW132]REL24484.1 ketoacyl-ACP synthase III [Rhodohalobacter sp. SW132]